MMIITPALVEQLGEKLIVDAAMFFGLFVIAAMALNFQYGNAGIPNMGCALSAAVGGYTVSAIITRVVFWIAENNGISLLPYSSNYDWMYNNPSNINMVNAFFRTRVILSISIFLFSIALGFIVGYVLGYVISLPGIRLSGSYLIITLTTMAEAAQILARNVPMISGGTLGSYAVDLFAWYPGDRSRLLAVITLSVGLLCYFTMRIMINSPYGRLMRSIRENSLTVQSIGKDVTKIRREILMFSSGITAVLGVLVAYYYSFVIGINYSRSTWTYWPWLMLTIGGPGNNAGTFLGTALVILGRRMLIMFKWNISKFIWYPIAFLEDQLLGVILIVIIIFKPRGLIPEKLLRIPGIKYRELVRAAIGEDNLVKAPEKKEGS